MAIKRSPIVDLAEVTDSDLKEYEALMQSRVEALKTSIEAYQNKQTHGVTQAKLARVLGLANFLPAPEDRYRADRAGKAPTYIVVCRVGEEGAPARRGNLLAAINTYAKVGGTPAVAPHVLVGVSGEVVQFVDLEYTASFLKQTFPGPPPLTYATKSAQLADSVMAFTARFESGSAGYAAMNRSDGGYGISFGFIQFNQHKGTLSDLMQAMHKRNRTLFYDVFGEIAPSLLDTNWVRAKSTDLTPHVTKFIASAQHRDFQLAQREVAGRFYWEPAVKIAKEFNITSQRGHALIFDALVQRGEGNVRDAMRIARGQATERDKLYTFASIIDGTAYKRRYTLLEHPGLSDAPLASIKSAKAPAQVSDETTIVVMLEGRTGDPITTPQRDAAAQVLQVIHATYGIPLVTDRVVGLDALSGATKAANPGPDFNFFDLLGAADNLPAVPAAAWYKDPKVLDADAVSATALTLKSRLSQVRTRIGLNRLAILQAYDKVKEVERGFVLASRTRNGLVAGAALEGVTAARIEATTQATVTAQYADVQIPKMSADVAFGLIYNFETGYWSDGRTGGKISV
jgi:hypothetical protein